ncbi:hypothetical protein CC86DRAFT_466119 [Ophiobolus disseminans]|uniref:Uncharacterized protein n=1 Tax=Ophiobolus disseminans TaxID=1469910 RepID=A0A6A7A3P2_9PLEO|nr:hypothetical protein CC86DRAFT_466119 [Ophiobolus disseminans]
MHSELDGPEKSFPPPKVSRRALNSSSALGTDGLFAQETHSSDAERLELSQISVSVLKAGTKYPELRGPEDESTEKAVARFLRQYGQISASMRDPQGRLDTSGPSKRDLIKAQDELRAVKTRLLDQDDKLERYEGEFDDMNRTIASLKFQLKESESSHGVKLRKEQRSLQSENERLKSFYENQLRKSRDDAAFDRSEAHKRQKEDIKTIEGLETRLLKDATLWEQAYNKLKATNSDLEQRLHDAKADENERVYDLEAKWERKLQKEKVKYEDSINSLELDIGRLEGALAKERSHKEAELQNQRKELEEKYKEEKDGLRTEIDMFKVAVTQREHFKGLTDSEVANHYKRLANSIEDFSRVEWDFSKREAWPISESHMRQLGKNPRKMKLQIVQNTLWVLLYKLVFCSPFKILGAAGEEDDDERWTKIYSAGASSFEWPEIPAEVERSRFENAKAYTNAVGSTTNSSVRESFERSVTAIMNSIIRATERVATIQANDHRVLETVVRLAGKIWLESCSQRYRVVVVVSHGSGDILSLPGEFEGTLRLVVRPEVKRYGDSQGKHLTRGEPVAGWKGLLETYPQ